MNIKLLIVPIAAIALAGCWSPSERGDSRPTSTSTPGSSSTSPTPKPSASSNMSQTPNSNTTSTPSAGGFKGNLPSGFKVPDDAVGQRMLREYGAMFVARGVGHPPVVVFADEAAVTSFQNGLQKSSESIGGVPAELQAPAMKALKEAIAEGQSKGLKISPRNADSSRRSYQQTVDNWASRVKPGLDYWVGKGRLQKADADRIAALSPSAQVPEIFKLEDQGIFFAKSNDKSIIYSVAPPGTSQHISMLALDVAEFENPAVRALLASHGWFQTVTSDLPHFTFLGAKESELPSLGLKKVEKEGRVFWVPEM